MNISEGTVTISDIETTIIYIYLEKHDKILVESILKKISYEEGTVCNFSEINVIFNTLSYSLKIKDDIQYIRQS